MTFLVEILNLIGDCIHMGTETSEDKYPRTFTLFGPLVEVWGWKYMVAFVLRLFASLIYAIITVKCRGRLRKLTDADLSRFMINTLLRQGFASIITVGYFSLESLKCIQQNPDDWSPWWEVDRVHPDPSRSYCTQSDGCENENCMFDDKCFELKRGECDTKVAAQYLLGGILALYLAVKIVVGGVPKRILEKHIISLPRLATLKLTLKERLQVVLFGIACLSGMMLLVFAKEADSNLEKEEIKYLWVAGTIGSSALFILFFWNGYILHKDLQKRDATTYRSQTRIEDNLPVSELSWVYEVPSVIASLVLVAAIIAATLTPHNINRELVVNAAAPITTVLSLLSYFGKLKRPELSRCYLAKHGLLALLYACYVSDVLYLLRKKGTFDIDIICKRVFAILVVIPCFALVGVKRQAIIRKSTREENLSKYLVNTVLMKGVYFTIVIVLVQLRTLACVVEAEALEDTLECETSSVCGSWFGLFAAGYYYIQLLQPIPLVAPTAEDKAARLRRVVRMDLPLKEKLQGGFTALLGICAMIMFVFMTQKAKFEKDHETEDHVILEGVGWLGLFCVFVLALVDLIPALIPAWCENTGRISSLLVSTVSSDTPSDQPVLGISRFWDVVMQILYAGKLWEWALAIKFRHFDDHKCGGEKDNFFYAGLTGEKYNFFYEGLTRNELVGFRVNSFTGACLFFMFILNNPRCNNWVQKLLFAWHILGWGLFVWSMYLEYCFGWVVMTVMCILIAPSLLVLVRIRRMLAALPDEELSAAICDYVKRTISFIGIVAFLELEYIKCENEQEEGEDKPRNACDITQWTTSWVIACMFLLYALNVFKNAFPKDVRHTTSLTYEDLAMFRLTKVAKIQAALSLMAFICLAYVFTTIGYENSFDTDGAADDSEIDKKIDDVVKKIDDVVKKIHIAGGIAYSCTFIACLTEFSKSASLYSRVDVCGSGTAVPSNTVSANPLPRYASARRVSTSGFTGTAIDELSGGL
jgi:hypothetical protein